MRLKEYFREIFSPNPNQDEVIDAVRAMSVLSIIAFHVVVGVLQIWDHLGQKKYILEMPPILQFLWHGEKGVDAFFLISATVLGIPLFSKLHTFDFKTTWEFYKKRFWRIYPLFFVALILYTLGQWSYFGKYFWTNLLLINNLIEGQRTIIPVGWSLLVEVQYYVLLPILFFALKKFPYKLGLLISVFISSFVFCGIRLLENPELYLRPLTDLFLAEDRAVFAGKMGNLYYEANLTRYGAFVAGLLLAYLKVFKSEELKLFFNSSKNAVAVFVAGLICLYLGIAIPVYHPDSYWNINFNSNTHFLYMSSVRQIFAIGLLLLILGCWYSKFSAFQFLKKTCQNRFWLPFSRLSFPIYLFHFPFIAVAAAIVFRTLDPKTIHSVSLAQGATIFILSSALTVLFSIPCYIFVERPFIEFGKRKNSNTKV